MLGIIEVLLVSAGCVAVSLHFLHMLQQESYQLDGYLRWLKRNVEHARRRYVIIGAVLTVLYWYLPIFMSIGLSVGMAIGAAIGNIPVAMSIGLCVGIAIGVALDVKNKKDKEE